MVGQRVASPSFAAEAPTIVQLYHAGMSEKTPCFVAERADNLLKVAK